MSSDMAALVSDNLDLWTAAIERRSGAGRGGGKKVSLYGIERLRLLILDLAVQGKLVAQDATDEPAIEALGRIAKARRVKVAAGLARKPKGIAALPDDLPAAPRGWLWTQLGTIAEISPGNQAPDDVDASFVPMALVSTSIAGEHESETRRWGEVRKGFTQFADGDLGLAKITPCFENGKAAIFQNLRNGIGAGTTELHVARPWSDDIDRRYVLMTMKTASYLAKGEEQMTGTAGQKRVTRTYFEASPLPLPPLAEQQRIVAKVNELMALCDALESQSASALEAHQALVETLLATLINATDPADLARQWVRLETHFDTLITTDASIEALKQAVLELAVRGKLVSQKSDDKHSRPPTPKRGKAVEPPFPIPSSWLCLTLAALGELRGGGTPSKARLDYWEGPLPWVSPKDMKQDYLSDAQLHVSEGALAGSSIKMIPRHSVLFVVRGMILAHSFPVGIATVDLTINQDMKALILDDPEMDEYVLRALKGLKRNALERIERSSHGTCRFDSKDYSSLPIPIPPLAEQKRIVAKVDELIALCDALKARLTDDTQTRKHLADAIVERAAA